jgi:citrate lyase subunit beta/citryl-CoA lyase
VITPRSFLFVPATRLDRIEKAANSKAGEFIIDLEDAVAENEKEHARGSLAEINPSRQAYVRINDASTPFFDEDVAAVSELSWVKGIVVPKVASANDVLCVRGLISNKVAIVALLETAKGIVASEDVAESGVSQLMFGSADYAADIGAPPSDELNAYPRSRLVVASIAAGLAAPIDGATLEIRDEDRLRAETVVARSMGMGAKLCIHPDQVEVVNAIFGANASELEWANRVLDAFRANGGGVFELDGAMVDAPVVAQARRILRS